MTEFLTYELLTPETADPVVIRITGQKARGFPDFTASNGVEIKTIRPAWVMPHRQLWILGNHLRERDYDPIHLPQRDWPDVKQAIRELNEHYQEKTMYSRTPTRCKGTELDAVKARIVEVEKQQSGVIDSLTIVSRDTRKIQTQVGVLECRMTEIEKLRKRMENLEFKVYIGKSEYGTTPAASGCSTPPPPNLTWNTGTPPQYVPIERAGMHGFYVRVNMMYYRVVSHGTDSTKHQLLSVDGVGAEYDKWRVVRDLPATPQHLPWRGSLCIIQEVDKCEPPALAVYEAAAFYKWMPLSSTPPPDRRCVGSGLVSAFLVLP